MKKAGKDDLHRGDKIPRPGERDRFNRGENVSDQLHVDSPEIRPLRGRTQGCQRREARQGNPTVLAWKKKPLNEKGGVGEERGKGQKTRGNTWRNLDGRLRKRGGKGGGEHMGGVGIREVHAVKGNEKRKKN